MHSQDVVRGHFSKMEVYASHCFIIHLPAGGLCPLVRDSEPIRLLEIPMSPSLCMLISFIFSFSVLNTAYIIFGPAASELMRGCFVSGDNISATTSMCGALSCSCADYRTVSPVSSLTCPDCVHLVSHRHCSFVTSLAICVALPTYVTNILFTY